MGTPSELVKNLERMFKNVWARVEEARVKYRPRYGYLSVAQAEAIAKKYMNVSPFKEVADPEAFLVLCTWQLLLLSSWRMTKGIYRFSPTIYDEILETPLDEALPCALFQNLPEWCVYIETPDYMYKDILRPGFFFGLVEALDGSPATLAWFGPGTVPIPCFPEATSIQGLRVNLFRDHPDLTPAIHRTIALTLYLCAQNADIGDGSQQPGNPAPTKTKHGLRTFPREKVRMWDVGFRVAATLRSTGTVAEASEASEASDGDEAQRARPRPHTRRAHRHSYWIKNEDGERELISRWVESFSINTKTADDLVETVRPVCEDGAAPASKKFRMH